MNLRRSLLVLAAVVLVVSCIGAVVQKVRDDAAQDRADDRAAAAAHRQKVEAAAAAAKQKAAKKAARQAEEARKAAERQAYLADPLHGCADPVVKVSKAEYRTSDIPLPAQDAVAQKYEGADVEVKVTNVSDFPIDVAYVGAHARITKPGPGNDRTSFSAGSEWPASGKDDLQPGKSTVLPVIDLDREMTGPYTTVAFAPPTLRPWATWEYADQGTRERCIEVPRHTLKIDPTVRGGVPHVAQARFTGRGLQVRVRACADKEHAVLDAGQFYAYRDGDRVEPQPATPSGSSAGRLKVPVAAGTCRSVRVTFPGVAGEGWQVRAPGWGDVDNRWPLDGVPGA